MKSKLLLISLVLSAALTGCQKDSSNETPPPPPAPPVTPQNTVEVPIDEVALRFPENRSCRASNLLEAGDGQYSLNRVSVYVRDLQTKARAGYQLSFDQTGMYAGKFSARKGSEFMVRTIDFFTRLNVPSQVIVESRDAERVTFPAQRLLATQIGPSGRWNAELAPVPAQDAPALSWIYDRRYSVRNPCGQIPTHYKSVQNQTTINATAVVEGEILSLYFWFSTSAEVTIMKLDYLGTLIEPASEPRNRSRVRVRGRVTIY